MSLIKTMLETYKNNNLNQEQLKKIQYKRLKKLVNYAKNNSIYYKELYKDIKSDFKLDEIPTTNNEKFR